MKEEGEKQNQYVEDYCQRRRVEEDGGLPVNHEFTADVVKAEFGESGDTVVHGIVSRSDFDDVTLGKALEGKGRRVKEEHTDYIHEKNDFVSGSDYGVTLGRVNSLGNQVFVAERRVKDEEVEGYENQNSLGASNSIQEEKESLLGSGAFTEKEEKGCRGGMKRGRNANVGDEGGQLPQKEAERLVGNRIYVQKSLENKQKMVMVDKELDGWSEEERKRKTKKTRCLKGKKKVDDGEKSGGGSAADERGSRVGEKRVRGKKSNGGDSQNGESGGEASMEKDEGAPENMKRSREPSETVECREGEIETGENVNKRYSTGTKKPEKEAAWKSSQKKKHDENVPWKAREGFRGGVSCLLSAKLQVNVKQCPNKSPTPSSSDSGYDENPFFANDRFNTQEGFMIGNPQDDPVVLVQPTGTIRSRFETDAEYQCYMNSFLSRGVIPDRGLDMNRVPDEIKEMVAERRWTQFVKHPSYKMNLTITREFYAKLSLAINARSPPNFVTIRGKRIHFFSTHLDRYFGIPNIRSADNWDSQIQITPEFEEVVRQFLAPDTPWLLTKDRQTRRGFMSGSFDLVKRLVFKLQAGKIYHNAREHEIKKEEAFILFSILTGVPVDVGELIEMRIRQFAASSGKLSMPFPSLITGLCIAADVQQFTTDDLRPLPGAHNWDFYKELLQEYLAAKAAAWAQEGQPPQPDQPHRSPYQAPFYPSMPPPPQYTRQPTRAEYEDMRWHDMFAYFEDNTRMHESNRRGISGLMQCLEDQYAPLGGFETEYPRVDPTPYQHTPWKHVPWDHMFSRFHIPQPVGGVGSSGGAFTSTFAGGVGPSSSGAGGHAGGDYMGHGGAADGGEEQE